jgi:hypothetical protein
MGSPVPTVAGWYPDAETGGMKYWDGSRSTGDTRPRRKSFAATSAHRGWGIALVITGLLFVLTSTEQPQQRPGVEDSSTMSPVGHFFFAVGLGLALAAWGVYLARGQGPTTKAIAARVATESTAANLRRVSRPWPQSFVVNVGASTTDDAVAVAQINALASPETARALQNLQNLLYTQAITDAEVQAAKDKLLGNAKRERAGTPAGWYEDGSGSQRWWDGQQWTNHVHSDDYADGVRPVMSFESETAGKRVVVQIFRDRVEWVSRVGVSAGKITAGILTGGLSLAVTGVGKGSYGAGGTAGSETILMTAVTRVASAKNGSRTVVSITTPSGVLPLRLNHHDAEQVLRTLNVLIANAAREIAQVAPFVVQVTAPATAPPRAPAPATPISALDSVAQIAKLAELRQAGFLSDAEFTAAKAKALGI